MSSGQYTVEIKVTKQDGDVIDFGPYTFDASNCDDAKIEAAKWVECMHPEIKKVDGAKEARWTLTRGYNQFGVGGGPIKLDDL